MFTDAQIEEVLKKSRNLPRTERELYRKRNWTVIEPGTAMGDFYGLVRSDWHLDSFLAKKGDEPVIEISLIRAKVRGSGALHRLLYRLEDRLQLKVRVICPLPHLAAILEKKGFVPRTTGRSFENDIEIWERP